MRFKRTNARGLEQACTAAYNCISSRLTFAQFLAADEAAREHTAIDPNTQAVITNCAAESRWLLRRNCGRNWQCRGWITP